MQFKRLMIVIVMYLAAIQTEVLHVCAMLDTQTMERFVKLQSFFYACSQLQYHLENFLKCIVVTFTLLLRFRHE